MAAARRAAAARGTGRLLAAAALALLVPLVTGCVQSGGSSEQSNSVNGAGSTSEPGSGSGSDEGPNSRNDYQVTQPVGQITLDARAGSVNVIAGPGPVSVTESLRYSDDKPATSHQVTGDTLALREDGCRQERAVNGRCEVEWEIHAPAGTRLRLTTRAGGIDLSGFTADVAAETYSGGVDGRDLGGRTVTATSRSGKIRLGFTQPPDQVTATTKAGGVDIEVPAGTSYAVRAETKTGQPDIDVPTDAGSPHRIDASTSAGSIDIGTS
ncbi:MAG TPA: DUF4097 family beta strand repeat-containing protein [Pseudonocardia sp.]